MGFLGDIGRSNLFQTGQTLFGDAMKVGQQELAGNMEVLKAQEAMKHTAILEAEATRKTQEWNDAHTVEDMDQYRKAAEDKGHGAVYKVMNELAAPFVYKDPVTGKEVILKKDRLKVADKLISDPHYRFRAGSAMIEGLQAQLDEFGSKFASLKDKLDSNPDATLDEQKKWSTDAQTAYEAKSKIAAEITQKRTALYWADPEFAKVMLAAQNKEHKLVQVDINGKSVYVPENLATGMPAYHAGTKDNDIELRRKALAGDTEAQAILASQLKDKKDLAEAGRAVFANMPTGTPGVSFERKTGRSFTTDSAGNKTYISSEDIKQKRLQFIEDQPVANLKTMQQSAPHVLDLANSTRDAIEKVKDDMGPIKGRFTEFMAGKIGTTNKDWIRIRTNTKLLETRLMNMHVGARGGEYILKHFENIFSFGYQSPDNMLQALDDVETYARQVKRSKFAGNDGGNAVGGNTSDPYGIR